LRAEMNKDVLSTLPADAFRRTTKAQAKKNLRRLQAEARRKNVLHPWESET
jgi:hypothetical protein